MFTFFLLLFSVFSVVVVAVAVLPIVTLGKPAVTAAEVCSGLPPRAPTGTRPALIRICFNFVKSRMSVVWSLSKSTTTGEPMKKLGARAMDSGNCCSRACRS